MRYLNVGKIKRKCLYTQDIVTILGYFREIRINVYCCMFKHYITAGTTYFEVQS